ncbi:MAG: type II toxin-antitoxin system ParD family antitoxin [Planctomycetes bacterium]|nr:type II toxin-antitoxin system ParD family antitoxin [Planctomycetota bacterium]
MHVSLTPEMERLVAEKIATGRYRSADEVIQEGLRLLDRHEQSSNLKSAINEGVASGAATPLDMQKIKSEARKRHERAKKV